MKLNEVVSYASRKPRKDETEGVEHYFISKEEAEKMIKENDIKIKTIINDTIYFSTDEEIRSKNCYKIDPKGLKVLKKEYKDLKIKTIYINCPYIVRKERVLKNRGNNYNFEERNKSEDKQFTLFEVTQSYDYIIENIKLKESVAELIMYIKNSLSNADLYCIVGRTGSGKDTIIKEANKILEKMKL